MITYTGAKDSESTKLFQLYMEYVGATEAPILYHRWASLIAVSTLLEKRVYFKLGHKTIYPNLFAMFIGSPGTRKSSAINIAKKLVRLTGYKNIAANKTTKEKFLQDLAEQTEAVHPDQLLDFLEGKLDNKPASILIGADEFNDFTGAGNMEFYSVLGSLWDIETDFEYRIKGGKDVKICNPAVNLLSGNTPTGFAAAFPPEIIGQGFFSRLLLIYGAPTGTKITFPKEPSPAKEQAILAKLMNVKQNLFGEVRLETKAEQLLDAIYQDSPEVIDPRFETYYTRRFTHLLKLCLVIAASCGSMVINRDHVLYANTLLTHTEHLMPKALGEFGKSRNADVMQKIMVALENARHPLSMKDIWGFVSTDLEKISELGELLRSLYEANKIQKIEHGFLPYKKARNINQQFIDYQLLTEEERNAATWN